MCILSYAVVSLMLVVPADQKVAEPKYLLRITPTEFFSGELKRLKDHVDFDASCFKLAAGVSARCRPTLELWCDGERVDHPKYGSRDDRHSDEVTVSWRRRYRDGEQPLYELAVGGIRSFGRRFEKPKSKQKAEVGFGPITIRKPVELKAPDCSVIVWAMGAGDGADLNKPEQAEKMLQTAPWVLILRLTAEKEE
jgi:hypothetical protein